jgi:hypothetical protein
MVVFNNFAWQLVRFFEYDRRFELSLFTFQLPPEYNAVGDR